jgi:L-lactate utilization protein LutB
MTKIFDQLAGREVVEEVEKALTANGFLPESVETGAEALARIKELVPAGATVMNGSSKTLEGIGYIDYLTSGTHPWMNPKDAILKETDKAKQALMRKQAVVSDFYLGSAHAVTEAGEIVVASNTGSQLPHLAYTSPNIILVVGTQKIVPTLQDALRRIDSYVLPLEDEQVMNKWGSHTIHAKTLILHKEGAKTGRKIHIIFVNEKVGF